jgi:AAA domain
MTRPRTQPTASAIEHFAAGIQSVDKLRPWVSICIYGRNGSGKTRFGASSPKCLIVDVREKGTRSAVGSRAHKREVNTFDEINLAYWYLKAGDHPYRTVVIDTVTNLYSTAMDKVKEEVEERDPGNEAARPTLPLYFRAGKLTEGMLLAFRNLDMHVVFLAQEKRVKDSGGEIIEVCPDLPEAARAALTDCVGIIGHIRRRRVQGKWRDELLSGDDKLHTVKDKTNELSRITPHPTMPTIIRAWNRRLTNAG